MPVLEKYKKIPTLHYVVYFFSSFNVFLGVFLSFYLDTLAYFVNSLSTYTIAMLILLYYVRLNNRTNDWIDLELDKDEVNTKRLWWTLIFKLFITTSFVIFVVYAHLKYNANLYESLYKYLTETLPSISLNAIKYIANAIILAITASMGWIIAILQGILGTIIYDYWIKPRIEEKRKKTQKPEPEPQTKSKPKRGKRN